MNNLLIFDREAHKKDLYLIEDKERLIHLNTVLKKKVGEEIKVCLVNKGIGTAIIKSLSDTSCSLELLDIKPGLETNIKLVVALSRPPTMKKILEHGSSLGVKEFHFYRSELTEKSYLTSKVLESDSLEKLTELGLAQSKCYYKSPSVSLHENLPHLDSIKSENQYLLKMGAEKTLLNFKDKLLAPTTFVLGPERGLIESENQYFEAAGFSALRVSDSTLRVEIACFAALSQLFLFAK